MRIVYKGNYIRMTCGEIGLVLAKLAMGIVILLLETFMYDIGCMFPLIFPKTRNGVLLLLSRIVTSTTIYV